MKQFYISLFLLFSLQLSSAQDFRFGKVSKEEVLQKEHAKNKNANAAVLYKERKSYFSVNQHSGFELVTEVYERIKIYNKDGFNWATKEITSHKSGNDEEEVSHVNGSTYNIENGKLTEEKLRNREVYNEEVSRYRNKTKFTMPAVKEGSVIEYEYTIRSPFLGSIPNVELQYLIPINKLEASVSIPEYLGFRYYHNPQSPLYFPISESTKNFTYNYTSNDRSFNGRVVSHSARNNKLEYLENIYSIKEKDIPALKDEGYVDYLENYAAFISWELQYTKFPGSILENYTSTWDKVTETIYKDSGLEKEMETTRYFEEDIDAILEGIRTPQEKIKAIYNFVKSKVKWNNYVGYLAENGAKKAYKEGEGNTGDINLMLIAMLKYAGFKASPVLLSTPDNGIPIYPTRNGFNYVVAGLELPNTTMLLDATDDGASPGILPKRARNWQGRIIRSNGSSGWMDVTPKNISQKISTINLKFDKDLNIEGKCTQIYNGFFAKNYREKYAGINTENYIKILEEDKGDISISNLEVENEKEIGAKLTQNYLFNLKNSTEAMKDKVYLNPMLFLAVKENPFIANERSYPIFFDFPSTTSKIVNIMVPEGYTVESLPESSIVNLNGEAAKFVFNVNQSGNFIRIMADVSVNNIIFNPQDYPNLKKFYNQILEKQSEAIVLSKI